MILLVLDKKKEDNDKVWLVSEVEKRFTSQQILYSNYNICKIKSRIKRYSVLIKQSIQAIRITNKDDTIICWSNLLGLLLNFILCLTLKKISNAHD